MNMKRTTKIKWGNLKVGIVIAFAVVVMFWASLSGGGTSIFESKGKFVCYFKDISGLTNGSPVWMSGVEVGNVKSVSFVNLDSERQVKVVCRCKTSVWHLLTKDARVKLGTVGLIGDKIIEILPGIDGGTPIEEMDVILTVQSTTAGDVFAEGKSAIGDVRHTINNIDTLLTRMNRGEGTLGQLAANDEMYNSMTSLIANLTQLIASLQQNQERIISSIEKTSNSVASLSDKVDNNTGTLGRLINDPELYDNLTATTAKFDSILFKINTAEGNLGLLVNDTALYSEMTNLMSRMNNLITDIQKDPRKYFKFSVF